MLPSLPGLQAAPSQPGLSMAAELPDHSYAEQGAAPCDLAFRCADGALLHAHRGVVSAFSPFFNALLEDVPIAGTEVPVDVPETGHSFKRCLLDPIYGTGCWAAASQSPPAADVASRWAG